MKKNKVKSMYVVMGCEENYETGEDVWAKPLVVCETEQEAQEIAKKIINNGRIWNKETYQKIQVFEATFLKP